MNTSTARISMPIGMRVIHLALAGFGIAAYLTGELAEDPGAGYLLHAYLGLTTFAAVGARILTGLVSRGAAGFRAWWPWRRTQWRQAGEDVRNLLRLRLPERPLHEGLAGLVQFFGLCVFAWMAGTGTMLFMLDAASSHSLLEAVEEAHEIGESLIPLFLALHVGAVLAHLIYGHNLLRGTFRLHRRGEA